MNYLLLLHTISHLKPTQVAFQIKNRLIKAKYVQRQAPKHDMPILTTEPIPKYKCVEENRFSFLNLESEFTNWNDTSNCILWTYNLNYFDFINQKDISVDETCKWIDKFIVERASITWGLDPYPIALRNINWIKYFCKYPECATQNREDSLWSQYKLLDKKLEYHLLGNHLLEDLYSLYIGSCYFQDKKMMEKVYKLLIGQLYEQTMLDGAHYEQSPMYHCILLDRLLDCINFRATEELKEIAKKQIGWMKSICFKDGSWPTFNDASLGISPTPAKIIDYANRLGIESDPTRLGASGYRKFNDGDMEVIIDCGNIAASYQPGHTHADSFNYELRIKGMPIVVDTGISTYNKTERRQYERSTKAHNCVSVDDLNSDEVWSGFRVGRHCKLTITYDEQNHVEAYHNGFGKNCYRSFTLVDGCFTIEDKYDGDAVSYIHLASGIDPKRVNIEGAKSIDIIDTKYSKEYNRFIDNQTIVIHFNGVCKYSIR